MAQAYVVLYADTPVDPVKVAALFVVGVEQNASTALSRANAFRDANFPTSVVQAATVNEYSTDVVINP